MGSGQGLFISAGLPSLAAVSPGSAYWWIWTQEGFLGKGACGKCHAASPIPVTSKPLLLPPPPKAALSDTESGVQLSSSERTADTSDGSLRGLSGQRTPTPPRHSSPGRGRSPRRGLSPACSDSSTLTLIHSALHRRQLQVQVARDPGGGARALRNSC